MIRRPPKSTLFPSTPLFLSRLCEEAARLTDPARSWAVRLGADGRLEWTDGSAGGPLHGEPETTLARRVLARVLGWLPIEPYQDRKSTRLNSSHANISYAVFC